MKWIWFNFCKHIPWNEYAPTLNRSQKNILYKHLKNVLPKAEQIYKIGI